MAFKDLRWESWRKVQVQACVKPPELYRRVAQEFCNILAVGIDSGSAHGLAKLQAPHKTFDQDHGFQFARLKQLLCDRWVLKVAGCVDLGHQDMKKAAVHWVPLLGWIDTKAVCDDPLAILTWQTLVCIAGSTCAWLVPTGKKRPSFSRRPAL